MKIIECDIAQVSADAIVNAANGIGFMGGFLGRFIPLHGVAESIHYATKGLVERESKRIIRKSIYCPTFLTPKKPGEVFLTSSYGLSSKWIIHAVTMRYPGTRSTYSTIERLLPCILTIAKTNQVRTLAIPLLGAGTGRLEKRRIMNMYEHFFSTIKDIEVLVCIKS
jgi:O-acetyl-ADP-ribose deacetylase